MIGLLRLEFPNALYHVASSEDRREDIYENDDDREKFLEILGTCTFLSGSTHYK